MSVYWLGPTNLDFSLKAGRFIERSSNIDVYTSLTVTNVVLTESLDAVDCLEAVTGGGHQVRMKARHFILAGGGIETRGSSSRRTARWRPASATARGTSAASTWTILEAMSPRSRS